MTKDEFKTLAQDKALQQGALGVSPCDIDENGHLRLCAASVLAYAGIQCANGADAARCFETLLVKDPKKDLVIFAFDELGWSRQMCQEHMIVNDSTPPGMRLAAFLQRCELTGWLPIACD